MGLGKVAAVWRARGIPIRAQQPFDGHDVPGWVGNPPAAIEHGVVR